MPYVVAVDIGGTFTDLVAFDHETGNATYTKSPTTYGNFVEGILDCFQRVTSRPVRPISSITEPRWSSTP